MDYFLLLDGIDRDLSTDTVRGQFHKSLFDSADEPYYDEGDSDQLVSNGRLRFGRYTIDPRYTDFKGNLRIRLNYITLNYIRHVKYIGQFNVFHLFS